MSHRFKLNRPKSEIEAGLAHASLVLREIIPVKQHHCYGIGLQDGRCNVYANSGTTGAISPEAASHACDRLNDVFDRLRYAMENPDTALSFADDGTPRLITRDDSGIDHETLFKIGRR